MMAVSDLRDKWDQRYRGAAGAPLPQPAAVLSDYAHLLPERGRALDVACGRGGNALFLAGHGLAVEAWDLSPVAIGQLAELARERQLDIKARVRDVCAQPPQPQAYDVITVSYFLERELAPALAAALRPGGVLFYQTFGPDRIGDRGPTNPAYRLAAGELLQLFAVLQPRVYRDEGRAGDLTLGLRGEIMFVGERIESELNLGTQQ